VLADHAAAWHMSAGHISELRRERVADHDLALLAALSAAAGASLRCERHTMSFVLLDLRAVSTQIDVCVGAAFILLDVFWPVK
jgi:hypothetical protein